MSTPCARLGFRLIIPAQCRAARALVEMDQAELAKRANVSRNTVVDFEKGRRTPNTNNLAAILSALQEAGVEFIAENGGGAGVRLRKE
ncbi:helix-turn-helix domain-containing protein [Jiella sp. M17.18]|uniref:helix-turn-helix domain-containing protein n=1 Tax=Jiella sp. M17.18 TaxID=3234247 RepID=UPI0034DF9D42